MLWNILLFAVILIILIYLSHSISLFQKNVTVHSGLSGRGADDHLQYLLMAGRIGGQVIEGGAVGNEVLGLRANAIDPFPEIILGPGPGGVIDFFVEAGAQINFWDDVNSMLSLIHGGTIFTTGANTAPSAGWTFDADNVTTGYGVVIQAGGLTQGDALQIKVDSDIVTTGKPINVLSGAALDQSVFSVDEEGSITCNKSDGTSRYYREFHLGASQTAPGASGATPTELKGTFSYLLNAITEFLYYTVDIHDDWDGATDVVINVHGYLTNAETANDLIRMSILCDYYGDHDNANAPKTQTLSVDHDIGSDNNQYDHHIISFTLDHDLGGNVLEADDDLHLRVFLDDVTTAPVVTGFNVSHVTIKYRTTKPSIEA